MLVKHPLMSLFVIVTFSLGIGLASTAFNITNGFVHKELPFEESHRILVLRRTAPTQGIQDMGVSAHDLVDWRRQQSDFEQLAAYTADRVDLSATTGTADGSSPVSSAYSRWRRGEITTVSTGAGGAWPQRVHG